MTTKFKCARCKKPVKVGECEGESGLYGSRHLLCEPCFFDEEAEVESKGTNDLPGTLASYGPPNDFEVD